MRRAWLGAGIGLLLVASSAAVQADAYPNGTWHSNQTGADLPVVVLSVDGTMVSSDVPAVILDGRTLVPASAMAQALGATVSWDPASYTARVVTTSAGAWLAQWKAVMADWAQRSAAVGAMMAGTPTAALASAINDKGAGFGDDIGTLGGVAAPTRYTVLNILTVKLLSEEDDYAGDVDLEIQQEASGSAVEEALAAQAVQWDQTVMLGTLGSLVSEANRLGLRVQ